MMKLSFSGHESFPLRYGWLKKAYDGIVQDERFFLHSDALIQLGVGKNMVRSIRYWGLAAQILKNDSKKITPTELGHLLLKDDGWDPYIENIGTVWLIHWLIVKNKNLATSWYWLFANTLPNYFTKESLLTDFKNLIQIHSNYKISINTIERDIDVILRTYVINKTKSKNKFNEELFNSLLTQLNLIQKNIHENSYKIIEENHPTLPTEIFEFALISFLQETDHLKQIISLDDLQYQKDSPGRVFRLSSNGILSHIKKLIISYPDFYAFDETAGLRQLVIHKRKIKNVVLSNYYSLTKK